MNEPNVKKRFRNLTGYYGILQTMHLFFLGRAGVILLMTGRVPFPASPPVGGWTSEVLPFLMGMAVADVIAIGLGIYFAFSLLIIKKLKPIVGIISLTIALSSAVVYLFGTLPGGAWMENPVSYLIVVGVFSPILPLYLILIRDLSIKLKESV